MCAWSAGHLARDAVVHELDLAAVGQQDVAPLHVAVEAEVLLQVEEGVQHLHNTQRQPVGAFNQEKALVGASSVIVKTDCETDGSFYSTNHGGVADNL